jgi:hypothetical protein
VLTVGCFEKRTPPLRERFWSVGRSLEKIVAFLILDRFHDEEERKETLC